MVRAEQRGDDCRVVSECSEVSGVASLRDDDPWTVAARARAVGEVQPLGDGRAREHPGTSRPDADHLRTGTALLLHAAVGLRARSRLPAFADGGQANVYLFPLTRPRS